jgi:lipoate-protein ligase A
MFLIDVTLSTLAENLALDEALLEQAEESPGPLEFLRLWESSSLAVVIGRSSRVNDEVEAAYCRARGIPVVRRCSGGAAVAVGPGCLMYAVVLDCETRPGLRMIEAAHRFVLGEVAQAIARCGVIVNLDGTSDLALGDRKVSGNSLRCKRRCLLYHGTILYQFPLDVMSQCLRSPPRQPDYRRGRSHAEFVANVPAACDELRAAMRQQWRAVSLVEDWPRARTAQLAAERYARDDWNWRM